MRTTLFASSTLAFGLLAGLFIGACSGSSTSPGFTDPNDPNNPNGPGTFGGGDGGEGGSEPCVPNAANYDVPGNGCDDDNDGKVDNAATCDTGLSISGDANAFAQAIGICKTATGASDPGYGLISATYTRGYGRTDAPKDGQHGILGKFGDVIKPREGANLGVLSSGYAREYDEASGSSTIFKPGKDWYNYGPAGGGQPSNGSVPPGFPKDTSGCPALDPTTNDVIDVKLTLKAPANAKGIQFDFNFWSGEWPAYVCSQFNDAFIAFLTAKGFNGGTGDNMSFDAKNNPVSVNNGFFDRCTPSVPIGCAPGATPGTSVCPGGTAELAGTGFAKVDNYCMDSNKMSAGGATGWLTSTAPVNPGEVFTIEFIIWDTGDGILDSSVLLDNFKWVNGPVQTSTGRPPA